MINHETKIYHTIYSQFIAAFSQTPKKTEVLTLGSFHFSFRNLDLIKTNAEDQMNVLEVKYQKEIEDLVARIAKFKPTIIAIERDPDKQAKYDSLNHQFLLGKDNIGNKKFRGYFNKYVDTIKQYFHNPVFKTTGIHSELIQINDLNNIKSDLGTYLLGIIKYQTKDHEYFEPDYVTGCWINRNLRIFKNIQKISSRPSDRILVLFGAGQINLLNTFFYASLEYRLLKAIDYLK